MSINDLNDDDMKLLARAVITAAELHKVGMENVAIIERLSPNAAYRMALKRGL